MAWANMAMEFRVDVFDVGVKRIMTSDVFDFGVSRIMTTDVFDFDAKPDQTWYTCTFVAR